MNKIIEGLSKTYIALIFIFLYAPIGVLILFSFNSSKSRAKFEGFTLNWYLDLFHDPQIMKALYYTISIAILSALIATVIGTAAGIGINSMQKRFKKLFMNLTYLPVLNPDIVTGISLMLFFIFLKMKLGFSSLLLAHITFNIPYVILSVLPKLKQLDQSLYEAALDLGGTPLYSFRKVILPQIMPGILSGALLAFTLSLDDFVISFFTAGSGVTNLSITIYSMARRGVKPQINALSTILFVSVLLLLFFMNYKTTAKNKKKGAQKI